jgi:hypothetical protein
MRNKILIALVVLSLGLCGYAKDDVFAISGVKSIRVDRIQSVPPKTCVAEISLMVAGEQTTSLGGRVVATNRIKYYASDKPEFVGNWVKFRDFDTGMLIYLSGTVEVRFLYTYIEK